MRIEFLAGKDERRIAKTVVRRLPSVRVGQPARLVDAQGVFVGWAIDHPDLDAIDQIRLKYVMDTMAAGDAVLTDPYYDSGSVTSADIKALKDRIDAVPEVDSAIRAYRQSQR